MSPSHKGSLKHLPPTTVTMKKSLLIAATLFLAPLFSTLGASPEKNASDHAQTETVPEAKVARESDLGHFTWGADLGSSVDLTANDMTSVDIHGYFGYKGHWLRFAGVGAGINAMLGNASRCYPIYAMLRTSFSSRPQLCFLDLRLGISFNSIMNFSSQTDFYGSVGLGITLAKGKKFASHIILSYNFMPIRPYTLYTEVPVTDSPGELFEGDPIPTTTIATHHSFPDLHFAAIRIGCAF